MEVAAFSGQGIPSGQMAELRRVARVPVVSTFLRCLSDRLTEALATLPPATLLEHFEHGLDVAAWASCDASSGPPALYFNSASVTLVLTLVVQLACFRYAWVRSGAYPAQASVGHSQGLAAALVVALSSCERSFEQHATELAATLLWFGLAVAEAIPRADSYALAVLKLDVEGAEWELVSILPTCGAQQLMFELHGKAERWLPLLSALAGNGGYRLWRVEEAWYKVNNSTGKAVASIVLYLYKTQ